MPFPVEDKWIDEAEQRLGIKLPLSYRELISLENGGEIEALNESWDLYHIWDKSDKNRLKRTCQDIVHETAFHRSCEGFPAKAVAIATNGCGDQLIYLPNETNPQILDETVFFWSHESREIEPVFQKIKR